MLFSPFKGLRPPENHIQAALSPPYDIISSAAAREMAKDNPLSFLHLSKPEIDLPMDPDPYSNMVYAQGAKTLQAWQTSNLLIQDKTPAFYIYRLHYGERTQTGLVTAVATQGYLSGKIKQHEKVRDEKLRDRTQLLAAQMAHISPLILTYKREKALTELINTVANQAKPTFDVKTPEGNRHLFWCIHDPHTIQAIQKNLATISAAYIADGHHRAAAAAKQKEKLPHFLGVLFPADELQLLGYHRVVTGLNGQTPSTFLARLAQVGELSPKAKPFFPSKANEIGLYFNKKWFVCTLPASKKNTLMANLTVSRCHDEIIAPLLGVTDILNDPRIQFVGGEKAEKIITQKTDAALESVGFTLPPIPMTTIMTMADQGETTPPKSTWFEPKIWDGFVILR